MFAAVLSRLLMEMVGAAGTMVASVPSALSVTSTVCRMRRLPAVPPVISPSFMPKRSRHARVPVRFTNIVTMCGGRLPSESNTPASALMLLVLRAFEKLVPSKARIGAASFRSASMARLVEAIGGGQTVFVPRVRSWFAATENSDSAS